MKANTRLLPREFVKNHRVHFDIMLRNLNVPKPCCGRGPIGRLEQATDQVPRAVPKYRSATFAGSVEGVGPIRQAAICQAAQSLPVSASKFRKSCVQYREPAPPFLTEPELTRTSPKMGFARISLTR